MAQNVPANGHALWCAQTCVQLHDPFAQALSGGHAWCVSQQLCCLIVCAHDRSTRYSIGSRFV